MDTVDFIKPPDGLGFALQGSCETDLGGVFVSEVEEDGPAAQAGLLVGDRLLAIGARGILWSSLKEVLFEISTIAAGEPLSLLVIHAGYGQLRALLDHIATSPHHLAEDATRARWGRGIEFRGESKSGRVDTIGRLLQRDLKRDANGSLGIVVIGGADGKVGGSFVTEVVSSIDIQPGDRLLEINGLSCLRWSQAETIDHLRLGGAVVRLVVQRLGSRQWSSLQASISLETPKRSLLGDRHKFESMSAARALSLSMPPPSSSTTFGTPSGGSIAASSTASISNGVVTDNDQGSEHELQRERAVREMLQRNMFDLEQDAQAREAKLSSLRRELVETHGNLAILTQQLEQSRKTIAQDQISLRAAQERDIAINLEMNKLRENYKHLEDEKSAVLKSLSRSEKELDLSRSSHDADVKRFQAQVKDLETQITQLQSIIRDSEEQNRKARVEREEQHSTAIADLNAQHSAEIERWHEQLDSLKEKHHQELEEVRVAHKREIEEMQLEHQTEKAQLEEKIIEITKQHKEDMQLAQEHLNRVALLKGVKSEDDLSDSDRDNTEESERSKKTGGLVVPGAVTSDVSGVISKGESGKSNTSSSDDSDAGSDDNVVVSKSGTWMKTSNDAPEGDEAAPPTAVASAASERIIRLEKQLNDLQLAHEAALSEIEKARKEKDAAVAIHSASSSEIDINHRSGSIIGHPGGAVKPVFVTPPPPHGPPPPIPHFPPSLAGLHPPPSVNLSQTDPTKHLMQQHEDARAQWQVEKQQLQNDKAALEERVQTLGAQAEQQSQLQHQLEEETVLNERLKYENAQEVERLRQEILVGMVCGRDVFM